MNIFQKGFNYVKNLLSFDKDEETSQYSTPAIITKKETPVFRAEIGQGMTQAQTEKAKEIISKPTSTKSLFTAPVLRAEIQDQGALDVIRVQTERQKKEEEKFDPQDLMPIRWFARGLTSAALQASGKDVYTPTGYFETALMGNDPVYNSKLTAKKVIGGESSIDILNQGGAGMLAVGLGINALDAADIFTGGGKNNAIKAISKLDKVDDIIPQLKRILGNEFDNDLLIKAANDLKDVTNFNNVKNYVKKLSGIDTVLNAQREAKMIESSFDYVSPIKSSNIDVIANSNDPKIILQELSKLNGESFSPILIDAKNYQTLEEFIKNKNLDTDMSKVYNEIYGQTKDTNKFIIPEGLYRGQGLPGDGGIGEIGSLPKDVEGSLSGLSDFINKNPDGFTVNLKGKPVSSGFAVSPYKGREVVLDKVDNKSLESFLLNNFDLLKEEGNNFGGWLNRQDGKFYLDISKVVDNVDDAIGYAAYNKQIGIYDLNKGEEIITKDFLNSKLTDIWNKAQEAGGDQARLLAQQLANINNPHEINTILNNIIEPDRGKMVGSINLDKLDLTPAEKANLKEHYSALKEELELVKGTPLTNNEVLEAARTSEVLGKVFNRAEGLKLASSIQAAKNEIARLERLLIDTVNPASRQKIVEQILDIIPAVDTAANFSGRLLQSFKNIGKAEDANIVNNILNRIYKAGADRTDVLNKVGDVDWTNKDQVIKFYREFVKPTTNEILTEFRYNSMLSNPRTHLRNISTNVLQTVLTRPLTRTIEAGIDMVSSALTGKQREVYFKEVPQYYRALVNNLFKATGEAFEAMKGNTMSSQFMELEGQIPTGKLPTWMNIPTLALEAGDRFFMKLITEGEKAALMKRGLNETQATKKAIEGALYSVFRGGIDPKNKTQQGVLLSAIDQATSAVDQIRKIPGGDWIVPFLRTPMNIAKQMVEYSPLGLANLAGNKKKVEALAKTFIGSTISAWAAKEAWNGNTTWGVPKDAEEKEYFYASGKKPYSIRVGDKWVPMIYFGPLGYAMAIPAAFKQYHQDSNKKFTDSDMTKIMKSIAGSTEFWTQQTFLENIGNLMDLIGNQDGKQIDKNLGFLSTQVIPMSGLLRYVSTIIDPVFRKSDSFLDEITKGLPFFSKNLDAYVTPGAPGISSEESKRDWWNYLAPWDITAEKDEFNKMLELRQEELQKNNYLGRDNQKLKEQAQSMYEDFMTGNGGEKRVEQIQKELEENVQLKNTFLSLVEKSADIEMAMADPVFAFKDPKYTAEIIYFRSQTAETDEEWQENVVEFIQMLEDNGMMTDEVKDNLERIIIADTEKAKMEEIEEESKKNRQNDSDWDVDISFD